MLNQESTKLEMSIFIADTLFGKHLSGDPSVKAGNWKVKELVRLNKNNLWKNVKLAERVRHGTVNSEILTKTPSVPRKQAKFFRESNAESKFN